MEQAVRQFARRVLLIHLLLLVLLLAVVTVAARGVYFTARDHALDQAEQHQAVLASETANGIQSLYESIFSDLELLRPNDPDDPDSDEIVPRADVPVPGLVNGARQGVAGTMLAHQLEGRLSHLFLIDRQSLRSRWTGIGGGPDVLPTQQEILNRVGPWLKTLKKPAMSDYLLFNDFIPHGLHVIAIPLDAGPARRPMILVAAVPLRRIEHKFLNELNQRGVGAAAILDENHVIVSSPHHELLGRKLLDVADDRFKPVAERLLDAESRGTELLSSNYRVGSITLPPAMLTVEPVRVNERQWTILVASPLSEVDAVLRQMFRSTLLWAIFVVVSMTAILVSTAAQLIRGRTRLEAERHDVLEREVREARKIQLAWLPEQASTSPLLDIATVNHPASHVSGDFYNWFELPDGRSAIAIGDVTGHGMSAAFLMATTQLLIRTTLPSLCDAGQCLEEVNRQLCIQAFNGQFVTMLLLILDPQHGKLELATAGHPAPLLREGLTGHFESIAMEPQLVLGVERSTHYPSHTVEMKDGAALLLYTDGIIEAASGAGERFGLPRLRQSVEGAHETAASILDAALSSVTHFRGENPLGDDLTLVAVQLQPREQSGDKTNSMEPLSLSTDV